MRRRPSTAQRTCASRSRSRIAARRRSSNWASDVVMVMVSGRLNGSGLVPVAVAPKLVKGGWHEQRNQASAAVGARNLHSETVQGGCCRAFVTDTDLCVA